jgi:hypothetical protein
MRSRRGRAPAKRASKVLSVTAELGVASVTIPSVMAITMI